MKRWSRLPNMLEKRQSRPGVAYLGGNKLVVAGGAYNKNYISTVECLAKDPANNNAWATAWRRLAPMHQARGYFQLVEFRGKLIAVGGRITEKPNITDTASVEMFQPPEATDAGGIGVWTRIASLTRPLEIFGCVLSPTTPNEVFAFGMSNSIFSYTALTSIFKQITSPTPAN